MITLYLIFCFVAVIMIGMMFVEEPVRKLALACDRTSREWRRIREPLRRADMNFDRWGKMTSEIKGSLCKCGRFVQGNSGNPLQHPSLRRLEECPGCNPDLQEKAPAKILTFPRREVA